MKIASFKCWLQFLNADLQADKSLHVSCMSLANFNQIPQHKALGWIVSWNQGWKKLRSLRSGILDNSNLVRQIRLGPGVASLLVRQIMPG